MIELGSAAQQEIRRIVGKMDAIEERKKAIGDRQATIRSRLQELRSRIEETEAKKRPVFDAVEGDEQEKVERILAGDVSITNGKSASDRKKHNAALDLEIAQLRGNVALLERADAECRDELDALEKREDELTIQVAQAALSDLYEQTIADMKTLAFERLIPLRQLDAIIQRLGGPRRNDLSLLRVKLGYWEGNRSVTVWPRDDDAGDFAVMPYLSDLVAQARSQARRAETVAETTGAEKESAA